MLVQELGQMAETTVPLDSFVDMFSDSYLWSSSMSGVRRSAFPDSWQLASGHIGLFDVLATGID